MRALLIAASLAANLVFAVTLCLRPQLAPASLQSFLPFSAPPDTKPAGPAVAASPAPEKAAAKLWAKYQTDNIPELIARLKAAGFPPGVIREVVRSLVNERYDAQIRALRDPDPNVPFWKLPSSFFSYKRYAEIERLYRERSKTLRDVLGPELYKDESSSSYERRRFGNLTAAKIEQIKRIEEDYSEMNTSLRAGLNNIELPEDREKFDLLAKEKRADLLSILSPDELEEYEMRNSRITGLLRERVGNFDASEAEFRSIYQAYTDFARAIDAGGGPRVMDYQAREKAQEKMLAELRQALGDARYVQLGRETDVEYRQLQQLGQRAQLSVATVQQAYELRTKVESDSNRILNDTVMTPDEKRAALKTLAQNTRLQITGLLGPLAAESYLKTAETWLSRVEQGSAVTFNSTVPVVYASNNMTFIYGSSPRFNRVPNTNPRR